MTPEETKKILAERKEQDKVMEHFVNGGEVECSYKGRKGWKLTIDPMWEWDDFDYRIKRTMPEVGKWYEFPIGAKYKCIAFEFGYYYFAILTDNEPDLVAYQKDCDFSNFKEVQP